jgi:hypothetical protein
MIIRWLLTTAEKMALEDICPDGEGWDEFYELITGK